MRTGFAVWSTLNSFLHTHPHLVAAVLAKAAGEVVSPTAQKQLRRAGLTAASGPLLPAVRDVLQSGYQVTSDGPVIVNPFRLETEADRCAFEDCQSRRDRNTLRLGGRADDMLADPDGPAPSR